MLKLDATTDVYHERLSVFRQTFEDAHEISQGFVNLRGVGDRRFRKIAENLKLLRDVLERNTLQLGASLQRLTEDAQRGFDCFSALGKTIEKARTIEIADAGNTPRIRLRLQVAPLAQLGESGLQLFYLRR